MTGRFALIDAALKVLGEASAHQLRWNHIRAPHLPDFRESIEWAQARLQQLQNFHSARQSDPGDAVLDDPLLGSEDDSPSPGS